MARILIRNTTVLDPDPAELRILPGHDVLIDGQYIAAVQPSPSPSDPEPQAVLEKPIEEYIDGSALLCLPGFINSHAHAAMVLFRGAVEDVDVLRWFNDYIWRMESQLSPEDVYWGTLLAAIEMLESGVTCLADHYFFMEHVAPALAESGMRAHLAPTLFGQDIRAELLEHQHIAQRWHGYDQGRIQLWLGPHSPYLCSQEVLRSVLAEAKDSQMGIHLHVAETRSQVEASLSEHGATPVAYLERLGLLDVPLLSAHSVHLSAEDVMILEAHKTNVGIAHCPKTFLKLASGIAPVTELLARGLAVGVGSDGAASNNTLDMLEQMRLAAMLQKHQQEDATALPRAQAISLLSYQGARVLHQPQLGRLAPGYLADIALLRLDGAHSQPLHDVTAALVYALRAADVDSTIVNGQLLMRQRQLRQLDKARVLAEVQRRAPRLLQADDAERQRSFPS